MKKIAPYILAILACLFILFIYGVIVTLLGIKENYGGLIPILFLVFILSYVWKTIVGLSNSNEHKRSIIILRMILGIFVGLIVGNIAIMGLHYLSMIVYPLPEGTDMSDMNAIAEYVKIAPLGSLLMVMLAHIGGTFLAGLSTALVSKKMLTVYIIGSFFTLAGIYNLYVLPHPWWFNLEAILYLPAAVFGFNLIVKKN